MLTAVLLSGLAACGQLPQPFVKDAALDDVSDPLIAPVTEGVHVLPVEGVPASEGRLVAELTAKALVKQNVAASATASNRASLILSGAGRRLEDGAMEIDWILSRRDGTVVGERVDRVASDAELDQSVTHLVAWLVPRTLPKPDATVRPKVAVFDVSGAPGNGNEMLQRALWFALRRAPVQVTVDADPDGHVVQGDVTVERQPDGRDVVTVAWTVVDGRGGAVGSVDQQNAVPGGSLDQDWGPVAAPIASAAVPGIVALLRQSEALKAGPRSDQTGHSP